ncbi:3'(2'),5'-bisphosphate nucleotidase CysQ [Nitratireductor sp. GISD-1A_MAKvit]|uniref:3'(2'),5'-bisphosphate nucleotidase CysQ n=1 Tax=Nitratireductor sp. GISD-1A_MAKvit TaxID=3234198 RepID=UPI0034665B50
MPETRPHEPSLQADLELIATAARQAGDIALKYFRRDPEVWWKEGDSPVSEADYAVDRFLRTELLAARPEYGWLSEETALAQQELEREKVFVVDPIDGTRAFIDGRPVWCVSIGVVHRGKSVVGVLECPALSETYHGLAGAGAFCNGQALAVKPAGEAFVIGGPKAMISELPADVLRKNRAHGYVPSLAYRIAMVASGALDATFVKPNSHDWDLAAADVILSEAGGTIRDAQGNALSYASGNPKKGALAAGSGVLLDAMTQALTGGS